MRHGKPAATGGQDLRTLARSQSVFAQALTDPSDPAPDDIRRPEGASRQVTQTKRFDVYRNNVTVTVIDALGDNFPVVRALVGDAFFRATARAYFDREPPSSPLLFRYGETFGAFLEDFPPAARLPYLGDVARLEFARLQAYHAADAKPMPIAALADIPPEDVASIRLEAHPSICLIRSDHPIVSLWGASSGLLPADRVDLARAEDALILRPALEVQTSILPAGGGAFLAAILAGETLGDAAAAGAAVQPDFDLSAHLTGLFDMGTFVRAQRSSDRPTEIPALPIPAERCIL